MREVALSAFGRLREHSNSGKASMAVPLRLEPSRYSARKHPVLVEDPWIKDCRRQTCSFHAAKMDRDATAGQQPI